MQFSNNGSACIELLNPQEYTREGREYRSKRMHTILMLRDPVEYIDFKSPAFYLYVFISNMYDRDKIKRKK